MKIHIVKRGDTLYKLSQKYNVDLDALIAKNPHITNPDSIDVGTKVKIPTTPLATNLSPEFIKHKHIVKQGDSLWKLSKAWGVPLQAMIKANPQLKSPHALLTGEVVNIPDVDKMQAAAVSQEQAETDSIQDAATQMPAAGTDPTVSDSAAAANTAMESNMQSEEIGTVEAPQSHETQSVENSGTNVQSTVNQPTPYETQWTSPLGKSPLEVQVPNEAQSKHLFQSYQMPATEAFNPESAANLSPFIPVYQGMEGQYQPTYSGHQLNLSVPYTDMQAAGNTSTPQIQDPYFPQSLAGLGIMPNEGPYGMSPIAPPIMPYSGMMIPPYSDLSGAGQFNPWMMHGPNHDCGCGGHGKKRSGERYALGAQTNNALGEATTSQDQYQALQKAASFAKGKSPKKAKVSVKSIRKKSIKSRRKAENKPWINRQTN